MCLKTKPIMQSPTATGSTGGGLRLYEKETCINDKAKAQKRNDYELHAWSQTAVPLSKFCLISAVY